MVGMQSPGAGFWLFVMLKGAAPGFYQGKSTGILTVHAAYRDQILHETYKIPVLPE